MNWTRYIIWKSTTYELTSGLLFYSCCQSDRKLDFIPTNCFESNRCPGMHWLGKEACSNEIMNSIGQKLISKSAPQQIRDWFHASIPIIGYILEDPRLFHIHSYSIKPKAQTLILIYSFTWLTGSNNQFRNFHELLNQLVLDENNINLTRLVKLVQIEQQKKPKK